VRERGRACQHHQHQQAERDQAAHPTWHAAQLVVRPSTSERVHELGRHALVHVQQRVGTVLQQVHAALWCGCVRQGFTWGQSSFRFSRTGLPRFFGQPKNLRKFRSKKCENRRFSHFPPKKSPPHVVFLRFSRTPPLFTIVFSPSGRPLFRFPIGK
jgi:hypothetical protein